ncbi:MAG TPA: heparinase II/III family protein [Caulobacteraceae bacterium]|jgi:uncharacterized heparinase superfamily protein|nr:heparinase II/III family protein [Caulobacteraceae bacterium]
MADRPRLPASLTQTPADLFAALRRQALREWRAGPVHRLRIAQPKTDGLAIRPRDFRPTNLLTGARVLTGEFAFGGERLESDTGGDPWRRPLPSHRFAVSLHSFSWLSALIATGELGQREALRLWLEWRRVFGRYNAFAWSGLALERRVFNLATNAASLAPIVSDAEGALFVGDLARQARHLLGEPGEPGRACERAVVAALVGAALSGRAGEALRRRALPRLERLLPQAVLRDGVHASRSPERGLELLFDLMALDDALSQLGAPAPIEVSRAIDRLSAATRFFTLDDGRLAAFQGGEAGERDRIAAAKALDATASEPPKSLAYGGYHRLEARGLQVIADAGEIGGDAACRQPGALSVVCDGQRLVAGSAWSARADADPMLREPNGGSCLALGGAAPVPAKATAERQESDEAIWLDYAHDGWRAQGFDGTRRLYIDLAAGELRGEDVLTPVGRPRAAIRCEVRFHLAPEVGAQLSSDGKSALLRLAGPSGRGHGWRLRGDAAAMELTPGVAFEAGEPRGAQVISLVALTVPGEVARVRWKLSRDEG